MNETKYTEETVLWVKRYSAKLMGFAITRPLAYRFAAGQFARLGLPEGVGFVWRAYSIVSPEYDDILEFYAVLIEDGAMSARLVKLQAGDGILLDKTATGFLLPERFVDGRDLIMLSTGSGIAPFLSMLGSPAIWQRFGQLALAHSVSFPEELVFRERIQAFDRHPLLQEYAHKLRFLPVVTRSRLDGALCGQRLPEALRNGELARALNMNFTADASRFMLCGNPAMVKDTFQALLDLGFAMHRNRQAGHIIMENGF